MKRKAKFAAAAAAAAVALSVMAGGGAYLATAPADAAEATIYKDPNCGCCTGHADYLREHGYKVTVVERQDMTLVKQQAGIPEALQSCHTAMIEGYAVEGHVPVTAIDKLLAERPKVRGISLPGMPQGSPGMSGAKEGPFEVVTIEAAPRLFLRE